MKRILICIFISAFSLSSLTADNNIMIMLDSVHMSNDTFELPIAFENDCHLFGVSCGFRISAAGEAIAYFINDAVYVAPGSRADYTLAWQFHYCPQDAYQPDTVVIGGTCPGGVFEGVEPGLLEIMFYVPVFCGEYLSGTNNPGDYIASGAGDICIDSCTFVYPASEWFWSTTSEIYYPTFNLDGSSHCISRSYKCGDTNADWLINVSDAVYIINYVFAGGNPPDPLESADPICDSEVNVSDAVWIINYVFAGGNAPCDTDGDGVPDC